MFEITPIIPAVTVKGGVIRVIDSATGDIARTSAGWIEDEKYGWYVYQIAAGFSAEFDSAVTRTGKFTIKLSQTTTSGNAVVSSIADATPSVIISSISRYLIPIKPSTHYRLRCYAKTNNANTNGVYLSVETWKSDWSGKVEYVSNKLSGTNDWTLLTCDFTSGANQELASILLRNQVPGNISDAWFDVNGPEFFLEEVSKINNSNGLPLANVIITFDDGNNSQYDNAFPYMESLGLKGVVMTSGSLVGTAGKMNLAKLQEIYAAGWDVANHTWSHANLGALTEAQQESEISQCSLYLEANGMPRAARYLVYPFGKTGVNYNSDSFVACANLGIVSARTTDDGYEPSYFIPANKYILEAYSFSENTPVASVKGRVDYAIANNSTLILYSHEIDDALGLPVADFQEVMDYIALKKNAGLINVPTYSEWVTANQPTSALFYPCITTVSSNANIDQSLDVTGTYTNTYAIPTSINEGATHRQTFTPKKKHNLGVRIWPVAKGTGNWTVTVHDAANTVIGTPRTITNADVVEGALLSFLNSFDWTTGAYHFHITSTVNDGTVKANTSNDLETASFATLYSKNTTNFTVRTDTQKLSYTAPTVDGWPDGTVIDTATLGLTPLTLAAGANNIYYSSNGPATADGTVDPSLRCIFNNYLHVPPTSSENAARDGNMETTLIAAVDTNPKLVVKLQADPTLHSMIVNDSAAGSDNGGATAPRDGNYVTAIMAVSSADGVTPIAVYIDGIANKLLIKST